MSIYYTDKRQLNIFYMLVHVTSYTYSVRSLFMYNHNDMDLRFLKFWLK